MLRRGIAWAVVLWAVGAAGWGSTPAAEQAAPVQTRPQFRALTNFVEVDASVIDRDRRPIRGLKAGDFTILEDGKSQDVLTFTEINVPEPVPVSSPWMRDVAADVKTNIAAAEGRLLVLVMEDGIVGMDLLATRAKEAARRVVDELGPGDVTAVIFTRDIKKSRDFTSDRGQLLEAIDRYAPGLSGSTGARNTIEALRKAAEFLADAPQRRKALIYVSSGWAIDFTAPGEAGAQAAFLKLRMEEAFEKAHRANVNIYAVDPSGLSDTAVAGSSGVMSLTPPEAAPIDPGFASSLSGPGGLAREFLLTLASNTGGLAIVNNNEFATGVRQIFRENSSYYLLGYQSPNAARDGKLRRISVRVGVPGATVRARDGYYGLKGEEKGPPPSPIIAALSGLIPSSDLGMQVTVAPFALPGKSEVAVATILAIRQPAPASEASLTETVTVQVSAFGPLGEPKGSQRMTGRLQLRAGATGRVQYEVLSQLELKPGRYQLRFAATSALEGKTGSIYQEVEVPDFRKSGVWLSGVAIATDPTVAAAPKDRFAALLPIVPTARRDFWTPDRVTALVRVYQGGKNTFVPVVVTVRVLDRFGSAVYAAKRTLAATDFSGLRAADYRVELTMADLQPGPHLLTIEALGPDGKIARRDVRFERR